MVQKTMEEIEAQKDEAQRLAHDRAMLAARKAKAALADASSLDDVTLDKLADVAVQFTLALTGVSLFPYQQEFAWRFFRSLIANDGDELTALFARQSGKTETVACCIAGAMVLMPALAQTIDDVKLKRFRKGVWVGIFGPNYDSAAIMYSRMMTRMRSPSAIAVMADPDIDLTPPWTRGSALNLDNGSFAECVSAGPQTNIEGRTLHLIILEETQDIGEYKIRSSIHPMGAATNATIVKIGTPSPRRSEFLLACRRNQASQQSLTGMNFRRKRRHFQNDYTVAMEHNPQYAMYIEKEIDRLGYDSDDFKLKYRLLWVMERGLFISDDTLKATGVERREVLKTKRRGKELTFVRPSSLVTNLQARRVCAAIDFGRSGSSTIITIGEPWWENPIRVGNEDRHFVHILNWLEIQGDNHEAQHPQILDFLDNFNIDTLVVDATGKGDPIYSRLAADSRLRNTVVKPFIFGSGTKDEGYKMFRQELMAGRFTYPDGKHAQRARKQQRFKDQLGQLEKTWRGSVLVVQKPNVAGARDDYPDSAMMLCWAANKLAYGVVNPSETEVGVFESGRRRVRRFGERMRGNGGSLFERTSRRRR